MRVMARSGLPISSFRDAVKRRQTNEYTRTAAPSPSGFPTEEGMDKNIAGNGEVPCRKDLGRGSILKELVAL